MMSTVQRAREIAILAHEGQEYHSGLPYFVHPEAVANLVESDDEKMVAYLHDVIEDTPWTHSMLAKEGFSSAVLSAVMRLTHNKQKHSYTEYICGIAKDPLSRNVKMADLAVNLNAMLINPAKGNLRLKYQAARHLLKAARDLDDAITTT